MSTSRIPAVLDALVTSLTASLVGVTVVDGPPTQTIGNRALFIGHSANDDRIDFEQTWAGLGHVARNENMQIPNLLHLHSGDPTTKTLRDACFADLALIENALRTSPTIGIAGFTVRAQFGTTGGFSQSRTPKGLLCRVDFTINVETRI